MDKHIRAAIFRGDKAEPLGCIEKLDGTCGHDDFLSIGIEVRRLAERQTPRLSKLRGESAKRQRAELTKQATSISPTYRQIVFGARRDPDAQKSLGMHRITRA